jgi:two-component system sensor histidine kinase UhpB
MNDLMRIGKKLSKSEMLFGQLWEISVDGMRLTDENGIIIMVNNAYCRTVELSQDELVGKPFSTVYHSSEQQRVLSMYKQDTLNNAIKTHFERENTLWNKKKRWFEFSNSFLDIPGSGKITLSVIKDITERKTAELELVESEKKFRMLFNNANDAVFVTQFTEDKAYGDFIEVNDIACKKLGYTKKEFLSLSPSAIVEPKYIEEFNRWMDKLLTDNHVIFEIVHKAKDKKLIRVEISSHLFNYENKLTVLSIARDITERKSAEEKLKRTSLVLRNLASHLQSVREDERSMIAREVHDELGQVLTVLKIHVSLLSNKLRDDQEDLKEKINTVLKFIDDTVEIVQRITSKLRPGILDELGLVPAIEWQTEEFKKLTGIDCSLSLPSYEIKLDKDKSTAIFRVFQEALTNVVRHASARRVSITIKTVNKNLLLEVTDNGFGISSEQVKNPKSLGIISMKERALILGGEVSIEGIPNKGTTVTVEIPLYDVVK